MTRNLLFGPLGALVILAPVNAPAVAQYAPSLTQDSPRSVTGVRFRFAADGPVRGGFGLSGNKLLFGTETGSVYAIDARDGRMLWRRNLSSPVLSTPAIENGRAFFTTWDNILHAVAADSGRELWRADLGRTIGQTDYWEYYVSSPVIADGRLYVGSGSGRLYSVDPARGRILWSSDLGARIRSTPAITGSLVLVGTNGGQVVAVDRASGKVRWRFATAGAAHDFAFKQNDTRSVVTAPIVTSDTVIAGGRDGNIYGIDLASGHERWRETHDGGSWILGLASDERRFYSGSGSAFIVQAADLATGKELWRTPTANAMFGGLAKAGDVLVSNGINGGIFGLDSSSGAILWRLRLPDLTFSSPLVAPGLVYTGSDDGTVTAIDTAGVRQPTLDRYIYSFTDEPAASAFWFKPGPIASIRDGFLSSGYASLGSADLEKALATSVGENGRKIVVIADTRLPDGIDGAKLRSFLDGGGILMLIGPDPVVYNFDSDGAPVGIDPDKEKAAFGLDPAEKERDYGFNVSSFTAAARPLGLSGSLVTVGWVRPDQVSVPLALDRSGMATAWVKKFSNGGLLIDLPLPRNRPVDLSPTINAIELSAARSFAGLL